MKILDVLTIVLRARCLVNDPIPGSLMASPKGRVIYRIVRVTSVRTAGVPKSHRFRLICEPLTLAEVPEGAVILPWPRDRLPPPSRRRKAPRPPLSADPGSVEPAKVPLDGIRVEVPVLLARAIAAIREGRIAGELAQVARAARVGQDDGVRGGRDYGPGISLRPARARRGGILRPARAEIVSGPDPMRPNSTVTRARRVDPLTALQRAGTIRGRHIDAVEMLREQLEAAEASMPCAELSGIHASHQGAGISEWQLNNRTWAREAMEAVAIVNRPMVLWLAVGGSVGGYAVASEVRRSSAGEMVRAGLDQLADHYAIRGNVHRDTRFPQTADVT